MRCPQQVATARMHPKPAVQMPLLQTALPYLTGCSRAGGTMCPPSLSASRIFPGQPGTACQKAALKSAWRTDHHACSIESWQQGHDPSAELPGMQVFNSRDKVPFLPPPILLMPEGTSLSSPPCLFLFALLDCPPSPGTSTTEEKGPVYITCK